MDIKTVVKEAFSVIGKEGSSNDGPGFVQRLWADANAHYSEIASLAKTDDRGNLAGFWGLMSDHTRCFHPWADNFSTGLYLAGVEVPDNAAAPEGWMKWTAPASEYLCAKIDGNPAAGFSAVLTYMQERDIHLVGAVYDYNSPGENGQLYMYFPIKRL